MSLLDIYLNGSKSTGNTARNSNYFLLRLPLLLISLISQYLDVFSCAYTERPIVSYGLRWDSGVKFNFSKTSTDTLPHRYPLTSTLESVSFYAKYYVLLLLLGKLPCWRRSCLFFSVSVDLVITNNVCVCSGVIFCS